MLDYQYTCPLIDEQIKISKIATAEQIKDMITELNPVLFERLDSDELDQYVKSLTEKFYDTIEPCFEKVRSINEDMREEASTQIDDLDELNSELDERCDELENLLERYYSKTK